MFSSSFGQLTSYPSKHHLSITNNHSFNNPFSFHNSNQCYSPPHYKEYNFTKEMSTMHHLHKQERKMRLKKGENSNFNWSTNVNCAKWELRKNLLCGVKKMLSNSHFVFGFNAHIGPFTAFPDHQLLQK